MDYLVEHHRTGGGDMLKIEYREGDIASVFTDSYQPNVLDVITVRVGMRDAGVMIITKYSSEQVATCCENVFLPGLKKFANMWDSLVEDPSLRRTYENCASRPDFYDDYQATSSNSSVGLPTTPTATPKVPLTNPLVMVGEG